jgi:hypothetical protein
LSIEIAKYAMALKDALKCWTDANCEEHRVPCKGALKEFAEKFFLYDKKLDALLKALEEHKAKKTSPDEYDLQLWEKTNI